MLEQTILDWGPLWATVALIAASLYALMRVWLAQSNTQLAAAEGQSTLARTGHVFAQSELTAVQGFSENFSSISQQNIAMQNRLMEQQREIGRYESKLEMLQKRYDEREATIVKLQDDIRDLTHRMNTMDERHQNELTARDAIISDLREALQTQTERANDAETRNAQLQAQIDVLRSKIEQLENQRENKSNG